LVRGADWRKLGDPSGERSEKLQEPPYAWPLIQNQVNQIVKEKSRKFTDNMPPTQTGEKILPENCKDFPPESAYFQQSPEILLKAKNTAKFLCFLTAANKSFIFK
jgi:hypothetical protein